MENVEAEDLLLDWCWCKQDLNICSSSIVNKRIFKGKAAKVKDKLKKGGDTIPSYSYAN